MIPKNKVVEALSNQLKTAIKVGRNKHGITFCYAHTGRKIISLNYDKIRFAVELPLDLVMLVVSFYAEKEVKSDE